MSHQVIFGHYENHCYSPQLCVGFLLLILYPGSPPPPRLPPPALHLSHTTLSHTIFHIQLCHTLSFTYNFVTHYLSQTTLSHTIFHTQLCHTLSFIYNFVTHYLSHTTLSHTIFHRQLCHTPSFTHNFVTHHLSHTTLSHTIFHIQLCHTLSFTDNFVTHHLSHTTLSHTIFHIQLCHTPSFTDNFVTHHLSQTTLSHTIFHTQLCHTPSFTYNFVTHHLSHTTLSHTIFHIQLCHTHTIFHTQLCHTPSFTYNFVTHHLSHPPLSHTIFHIQLCHTPSFTPTFVTHHLSHTTLSHTIFHISHLPSFCVAGVAQTHICGTLRGRCGTNSHLPSFCVASTIVLRGRRGIDGTGWRAWSDLVARDGAALCVAGVAQTHIYHRFAWQEWHKLTSTIVWWQAWHWWHWVARLVWFGRPWRRGTLRGKRGTNSHLPSFCVAGVAQTHIYHRLAWSTVFLRGRRGTNSHLRHFAWQVWHKLTSTIVLRGIYLPSFCVAGVALMALGGALGLICSPVTRRHFHIYHRFAWQPWHKLTSTIVWRGRRGTDGTGWRAWSDLVARDAAALCVAGVAQCHIHVRFAWQAWHKLTSTIVLRGRRGTDGTGLGLIWSPVTPRHFAWQVWHNVTSTFVLLGRRGTNSHLPSFCVAGVALMALGGALGLIWSPVTPRHFAWQVWHNVTSTFVLRGRRGTIRRGNFVTHIHTYIHSYIHTYVHAYYLFTYLLALSHTVFHIPLCHTQLFYLLDLSPPPLSFLPSPSPLQPLKLSIGRSWLVGLSGPLIPSAW